MNNVKKIIIGISIIIVIAAAVIVTGYIVKKRADKIYSELEDRYNNIEQSNRELREINIGLENNNKRLRDKISGVNDDIERATIIVTDFEGTIKGTRDTIERIEITVGFIEEIVRQLPEKIVILEKDGDNGDDFINP